MALPTAILVEIRSRALLGREEGLMAAAAQSRGVKVERASVSQLERGRVLLRPGVVPVGCVLFVKHALRKLGADLPAQAPYPKELQSVLHRKVTRLRSLGEAKDLIEFNGPMFVRPADDWKRFTGFVASSATDPRFNGASARRPVWVSEIVEFVSEWRAYVSRGQVLDVRFADHGGDREVRPNMDVIRDSVARQIEAGAPAGYGIDFGVLKTGETALVEMNDGFSLGAYDGVSSDVYWDVIVNRWQELVQQAEECTQH